jgi:nucleoside 2-deoxyribosyltransferase
MSDPIRFVYIAGPLTGPHCLVNVTLAVRAAERLRKNGLVPFCPHLGALWEMIAPGASYEDWMRWCLAWLERCDAVVRLDGESPGADREVAHAAIKGIPVFYSEQGVIDASQRRLRPRGDQ